MSLFNSYMKDGPGVSKNEKKKKRFFVFFDIYIKRFWKLIIINLLYFACCIPVVTIGPATAGLTVVLRNYGRDTHSFVPSDFFDGIKKNWKQALAVSFIYLFVYVSLAFAIPFWYGKAAENAFFYLPFFLCIFIAIEALFASYYIFPMIVTFDMKLKQIIKNSVIFASIGLKTNIITTIILALIIIPFFIGSIIVPPLLFLIPFILLSTVGLIVNFNVYPYLKKYIIDPYYKEHPEEIEDLSSTEAIFNDEEALQ